MHRGGRDGQERSVRRTVRARGPCASREMQPALLHSACWHARVLHRLHLRECDRARAQIAAFPSPSRADDAFYAHAHRERLSVPIGKPIRHDTYDESHLALERGSCAAFTRSTSLSLSLPRAHAACHPLLLTPSRDRSKALPKNQPYPCDFLSGLARNYRSCRVICGLKFDLRGRMISRRNQNSELELPKRYKLDVTVLLTM